MNDPFDNLNFTETLPTEPTATTKPKKPEVEQEMYYITRTPKELKEMNIPKPEYIIHPWLRAGEIVILSAPAGVGKTNLMLGVSKIVTDGGDMFSGRWRSPIAKTVLYVDGEMRLADMKNRMEPLNLSECFHLISLLDDEQPEELRFTNLAYSEHQKKLLGTVEEVGAELVILDNLNSLYNVDRPNSQESWGQMQTLLKELRRRDVSVVLVDHEGKGENAGSPRGTSAKTDIADVVISLKRPHNCDTSDGATFEVRFTKARGFWGDKAATFTASLQGNSWLAFEKSETDTDASIKELTERQKRKAAGLELYKQGKTQKEIVEALGVSQSTVSGWCQGWRNQHPEYQISREAEAGPSKED